MHKYGKKHHKCVKQKCKLSLAKTWIWIVHNILDSFCLNPKLKTCQTLKQACDATYTNQ
jgi:hypothetical protein